LYFPRSKTKENLNPMVNYKISEPNFGLINHITHTPPKDTQGKQTRRRRRWPQNKDKVAGVGVGDSPPDTKIYGRKKYIKREI